MNDWHHWESHNPKRTVLVVSCGDRFGVRFDASLPKSWPKMRCRNKIARFAYRHELRKPVTLANIGMELLRAYIVAEDSMLQGLS